MEIYKNLNSKAMNDLKRDFTAEDKHKDSSCFLVLIISHGTADNFIQCSEGTRTWNIESLVTEVSNVIIINTIIVVIIIINIIIIIIIIIIIFFIIIPLICGGV